MKKIFITLFITIISISVLGVVIVLLNIHVARPDNVRLDKIQVYKTSVSFQYDEKNPRTVGGYLLKCKYEINDDVLTVHFYITDFLFLAKDWDVVIKASNIKRIDVQGKNGEVRTVWENGVSLEPERRVE